jgi:hypothetical protein
MALPMFKAMPASGATSIGIRKGRPKNVVSISGATASWIVRRFSLILARLSKLAMKEEPVPTPPMPGISPAQARPLQLGQTRQAPLNLSRAIRLISFNSNGFPFIPDDKKLVWGEWNIE